MSIIGTRTVNFWVSAEEWRLARCPLMLERRTKHPRWDIVDMSGYGDCVHVSMALFGKFWEDLDNIMEIYVNGWERIEEV